MLDDYDTSVWIGKVSRLCLVFVILGFDSIICDVYNAWHMSVAEVQKVSCHPPPVTGKDNDR